MSQSSSTIVATPPVPLNWDRCHAYNVQKRRFCRQGIRPSPPPPTEGIKKRRRPEDGIPSPTPPTKMAPIYCGNHAHLYDATSSSSTDASSSTSPSSHCTPVSTSTYTPTKGRRIPCPLDPSHTVYESALQSHLRKCPAATKEREERSRVYYRRGVNRGGAGLLEEDNGGDDDGGEEGWNADECRSFARELLSCYIRLFPSSSTTTTTTNTTNNTNTTTNNTDTIPIESHTAETLYDSIPTVDLSPTELDLGLETALSHRKIRTGGGKHVHQIASIVGHLRAGGAVHDDRGGGKEGAGERIVLEMGAGRGTTGFVVAGVVGKADTGKVRFVMVEKGGSRGRVDTALRRNRRKGRGGDGGDDGDGGGGYLDTERVAVERIRCDLAHVHLPSALDPVGEDRPPPTPTLPSRPVHPSTDDGTATATATAATPSPPKNIVVVAKHLCGVGTDLALKSLSPVSPRIRSCVFATCCHGVCDWGDYVGRDYLREVLGRGGNTGRGGEEEAAGERRFGKKQFDLMKRWAAGSFGSGGDHDTLAAVAASSSRGDDVTKNVVDPSGLSAVVRTADLACGEEGLSRVCRRLIDYGRRRYMEERLFPKRKGVGEEGTEEVVGMEVRMCHYVGAEVTPQNALLTAFENGRKDSPYVYC